METKRFAVKLPNGTKVMIKCEGDDYSVICQKPFDPPGTARIALANDAKDAFDLFASTINANL